MSGWWSEKFAEFALSLEPSLAVDVGSRSTAAMNMTLSPSICMEYTATSTGEFGLVFDPSVSMVGVNYLGTVALNLTPAIGMLAEGRSTASFGLSLTPTIGMVGGEHYTAAFTLTLTPSIGQIAYIKQLPHPIPWTL